jgi:pantetheine-phosphate adenylyltransferase
MRLAISAGSFDPLTNGHLDLFERAAKVFDRLVVAVLANSTKSAMFTIDERVAMLKTSVAGMSNIEVDTFDGLLADYAKRRGAIALVRGLRTAAEFHDEWPMAMMNRHLNPAVETVFLLPSIEVAFISSRLVKEIASLGGPLDGMVPPAVAEALARRGGRATIKA